MPWTPIKFEDNSHIILLCEEKEKGIYDILDNQCKTPKADGATFCKALHERHGGKNGSKAFAKLKVGKKEKRSNDDHFIVCHFAGDVVYFAGEFLDKNNDSLDAAAEGVLLSSSLPLVVTISTPEGGAAEPKKKKGGFQSVGRKVREHRAACPPST